MAGIDHFTKQQFEDALPRDKTGHKLCEEAGCLDGEYVYTMPVLLSKSDNQVRIEIRSSVGPDGMSAGLGENSIRAYLTYYNDELKAWWTMGSKSQRWVTRQPGWELRLTDMLRTLYSWRLKAGDCPVCNRPKGIFKVWKEGPNKGRVFARCMGNRGDCAKVSWVWLTEAEK